MVQAIPEERALQYEQMIRWGLVVTSFLRDPHRGRPALFLGGGLGLRLFPVRLFPYVDRCRKVQARARCRLPSRQVLFHLYSAFSVSPMFCSN